MAKLAHYTNERNSKEYIVIITEGEPEDYCRKGYELYQVVEIGDNKEFSTFPCDRPLFSEEA